MLFEYPSLFFHDSTGFAWQVIGAVWRFFIRLVTSLILAVSTTCILAGGVIWLFLWTITELVIPLAIQ